MFLLCQLVGRKCEVIFLVIVTVSRKIISETLKTWTKFFKLYLVYERLHSLDKTRFPFNYVL